MTQTDNSSNPPRALSRSALLAWLLLILATLYVCYFHNLGAIGFVGPDEPRYAWIARAMTETGDWVTPRLYGKPWFEKPVLYYWGAALSFKLFGVSEAAARLPSAICALLATLAMAWLAWRLYGAETARWLLLLLPTTVGMIGFSHAAAPDMPFAAMLTIAMVFAARLLGLVAQGGKEDKGSEGGKGTAGPVQISPVSSAFFTSFASSTSFTSILFGFFLGLAVLAKGPAAIILSGGAVLLWAVFTKRWRDAFRCLHPLAILTFCLTALPWYILCARRNPDFFRIFIIEHNFKRFLTPEFQHIQPFWFYIPVLLVAIFPWTLILLWSVTVGLIHLKHRRQISSTSVFLLAWALFCFGFFSVSKSKLPGYALPAVLPIGLLLAQSCADLAREYSKSFRCTIRSAFTYVGLPAATVLFWITCYGPDPSQVQKVQKMTSCAFALFFIGLANLLLANRVGSGGLRRRAAPVCVVPALVIVLAFGPLASPWLRPDPSARSIAQVASLAEAILPASECFVLPANRNLKFGLSFYLHRDVQFWDQENPKEGFLLLSAHGGSTDCSSYMNDGWSCSRSPLPESASTGWLAWRIHRPNRSGQ